jgi:CubicO group peptidase (beta-lactamase class C family)
MRKFAFMILFMIFNSIVFAQEDVDQLVTRLMEKRKIPGLALLVVKDGQIVKSQGYGFANLELNVPVKPETIFQSGSVGKQFTATAVMMLVQEGKMNLDDPVSKYIKNTPSSWNGITIRHLLTHTSGMGDYPDNMDYRKDYTEEQELEMVKKQPLLFKPGEKWQYSNLAYLTLGIIIHNVSGKFYGDFLEERVFGPIGMVSTQVISEADIVPNRSAGYRLEDGKIKNQEWVSPTLNTTADGALYFNIVDLAKWDAALNTEQLLSKSNLDQMWTPVKLNSGKTYPYGFGWGFGEINDHRIIEHGGSWQGFNTHVARYVDDKVTVVVLTNLSGARPGYIAHAVAALYDQDLALPQHTAIQLDETKLSEHAGEYKFESGDICKINPSSGKLKIACDSQEYELLPKSETVFFREDSEITVEFVKGNTGKITEMILRDEGEEETAKKIK